MTRALLPLGSILLAAALASPARAGGARVIAMPVIGCTDPGLLARESRIRANPGLDYDRLMRAARGAGQCRTLGAGMIVVEQQSDWFGGFVRVRPVGEPQAVWISRVALGQGRIPFPAYAGTRFPPRP
ncbi:MAG: hypothetical protein KGM42_11955 [Hyphomicrobiales bacterium]|nr:hypothetical protein [Hyphomicrobiales bacterium]